MDVAAHRGHVANGAARIGPIPFALTPLIGRDELIDLAADRITSGATRLLTLVGPGGIGKTRLAHALAHRLEPYFRDGATLIRFAAVNDPTLVRATLLDALGAPLSGSFGDAQGVNRLLVLDNFEQLTDAAPDVHDLLVQCPLVTVIVTSRVPLNLSGEQEVPVPPLRVPESDNLVTLQQSDAVRLFTERAIAADLGFTLTESNAAAVAAITRQLDGLPLAIELAAAQCRHMVPAAVVRQLEASFDVLAGGPIDHSPHQRSLRETIAWTYDLLDADDQRRFRALAIFSGSFTVAAASYVCGTDAVPSSPDAVVDGAMLEHCIAFSDRSLIYKSGDHGDEPRFSMLRTIRGYGLAALREQGELAAIGQRHAAWFLALAETAAGRFEGADQQQWSALLDVELPNLRAALEWYRDQGEWGACARLANALNGYWSIRSHHREGLRWLATIADQAGNGQIDPGLTIDLLCAAGWLAFRLGQVDEARQYASRALDLARGQGQPLRQARALSTLANIADRSNDHPAAQAAFREVLAIHRAAGNAPGIADTLVSLACIHLDLAEYDTAEEKVAEAIAITDPEAHTFMHARAVDISGIVRYVQRQFEPALERYEAALALYRQCGSVRGQALTLDHAGKALSSRGFRIRAWEYHREALPLRQNVGDPRGLCVWLEAVSYLLVACEAYEPAATILAVTSTARDRGGFPWNGHERVEVGWALDTIRHRLTREAMEAAWRTGTALSLNDAIALAQREAAERAHQAPSASRDTLLVRYGLTAREVDVLHCLGRRLTDKEIADELSISPRTASTHVASILAKMQLRSRREIPLNA